MSKLILKFQILILLVLSCGQLAVFATESLMRSSPHEPSPQVPNFCCMPSEKVVILFHIYSADGTGTLVQMLPLQKRAESETRYPHFIFFFLQAFPWQPDKQRTHI